MEDHPPIATLFRKAERELTCPTCGNNPRGYGGDECPECHGEHRYPNTIALLDAIARYLATRG